MLKYAPITEQLLRRIADSVPAIVGLYSATKGKYLYVNQGITRILGYTPTKLLHGGMAFATSLIHPDDLDRILKENREAIEQANARPVGSEEMVVSFEYRMRHKNGEWRWMHTDGTVFERDKSGKVELVLNVSLDVTDRRKAEMQLSRSLTALEKALNA